MVSQFALALLCCVVAKVSTVPYLVKFHFSPKLQMEAEIVVTKFQQNSDFNTEVKTSLIDQESEQDSK